jgi:hypothetical protein
MQLRYLPGANLGWPLRISREQAQLSAFPQGDEFAFRENG